MDPIFSPIDPRAKLPALAETAWVQREIDDGLRVMWDGERQKFVVLDSRAPGGPEASYVLLVQNPDGSFRPFDQRTIDKLRELRFGHDRTKAAVAQWEAEREMATAKRRSGYGDQIEETLKYFGKVITPSVASRERRAEIRKEAGL